MADQYRNIELEKMFQDLGRALEANEAKRAHQQATAAPQAMPQQGGAAGAPIPTARFADVPPGGAEQVAPMTIGAGPQPRPPMTPQQQALSGQLDAMGNQVAQGISGGGAAAPPMGGGAGVSPGQLDAMSAQATQGMGTPANLPQIQPVDQAGLEAYARMQRGGY
jgi:hypothetical protein